MGLVINDIVQVSFRGRCLDQRIIFTNEWMVAATASTNTPQQDLQAISLAFGGVASPYRDAYLACLPSNYTLETIRAQLVYPTRVPYAETLGDTIGTWGTDCDSPVLAAVGERYTENSGRNQIALSHVGPIATDVPVAGYISGLFEVALTALMQQWLAPVSTLAPVITLNPVVFHRSNPVPIPASTLLYKRIKTTVRTMNRRTIGYGE